MSDKDTRICQSIIEVLKEFYPILRKVEFEIKIDMHNDATMIGQGLLLQTLNSL